MIECKMIRQQINKIFKNCILANQKFTEAKSQIVKIYRRCKKIKFYKKNDKNSKVVNQRNTGLKQYMSN